jgi:hypothetical protein
MLEEKEEEREEIALIAVLLPLLGTRPESGVPSLVKKSTRREQNGECTAEFTRKETPPNSSARMLRSR